MKKNILSDKYSPKEFEEKIYKRWIDNKDFTPVVDKNMKPYTIIMPPPNITGKLHMGHALDDTIQDILIRYKKMSGYNTLWIPGTDHASIATEAKVVVKLKAEGTSKEELGREAFIERTWEWKEEFGGAIKGQVMKLGCACDWTREKFTLDQDVSKAVEKVFIDYYNKGYIYKGARMINWCPTCKTSISDAEVEFEEENAKLWYIKYKSKENDFEIIIATTRPETMLADTAIAVHPDDDRYKNLIGKKVVLPIVNKEIEIIADNFVEKDFGTGAVKITPAHDQNDYEVGLRHKLEMPIAIDDKLIMTDLVPKYEGMTSIQARKLIVEELETLGLLVKTEELIHNVGKCYRCHETIEPIISEQWFVKMTELAKPANEAVRNEIVKFVPKRFEKTYFAWMDNVRDWCISRQLWWGHRIPAYYCLDCNEIHVSDIEIKKCKKCGSLNIVQDEDTLDTWFSSALWPFSTLGWPEETEDYEYFYPTNVLVTAYDIIFFWVARMIFSGFENTGKKPFDTVLIHGLVRDSKRKKNVKKFR